MEAGDAPASGSLLAYLRAVAAASERLAAETDLKRGIDTALGALRQHAGLDRVFVLRDAPGGDGVRLYAESLAPGVPSIGELYGDRVLRGQDSPEVIAPLRTGKVYQSVHPPRTEENAASNDAAAARSQLMVPVFAQGCFWGIVGFDDCHEERRYSPAEIDALKAVANTLAGAIGRHQAEEARLSAERLRADDTAQINRLLEGVVAASRALLDDDNFEGAMQGWLAYLATAVEADRAMYGDYTPFPAEGTVAAVHLDWTRQGLRCTQHDEIPASSDFLAWTQRLARGETIWAHRDELLDPISVRYWESTGCWTNLIVPVVVEQRTVGWLCFDFETRRDWKPALGAVLRTAADGAAAAIKRRWAVQTMLAERDRRIEAERARAEESARMVDKVDRHAQLLSAVAASAEDLLAAREPWECMDAILARLSEKSGAQRAGLNRFDWTPDDPELRGWQEVIHEWAAPGEPRQMDTPMRRFPMRRDEAVYDRFEEEFRATGRLVVLIAEQEDGYREEQQGLGVVWSLAVPFFVEGVIWGALGFDYATPFERHDEAELSALQTVASSIADALIRQRLEARALAIERERANENARMVGLLEVALRSSRTLFDAVDFEPALRRWLGDFGHATGAQRATFYDIALHPASGLRSMRMLCEWVQEGTAGSIPVSFEAPFVIDPRGAEPAMAAVLAGKWVYSHAEDTRGPHHDLMSTQGNATVLVLPIVMGGATWGCLSFDFAVRTELSASAVAVLTTANDTLAVIVKRNEADRRALEERDRRIELERRNLDVERARAEDSAHHAVRLERHSALLAAVAASAEELLASRDPGQRLDAVLERVGQVTNAARACMVRTDWLPDDPLLHGWQEVVHEWSALGALRQMDTPLRRFPMQRGDPTWSDFFARVAGERRIVEQIDRLGEPFRSEQQGLGVVWCLVYPITVEERLWGLLGFDYATPFDDYDQADLDALQTVASTIADALTRRRLEERAIAVERQRADESARLASLLANVVQSSRLLIDASPETFEPALLRWLGAFGSETRATRATLYDLVDFEPTGRRTVRMLCEWVREGVQGSIPVSFDKPHVIDPRGAEVLFERLTSGQPAAFHTDDAAAAMRDFMVQQGNASVVAVPIFIDGRQWGNLSFDYAERRELEDTAVAVLQTAADTLAAVLKRNEAARSALAERDRRIELEQRSLDTERARTHALRTANDELITSMSRLVALHDLPAFMAQLLVTLTRICGARTGALLAFEGAEGLLQMRHCVIDGDLVDVRTDTRLELWRQPVPDAAVAEWRRHLAGQVLAISAVPASADGDVWPQSVRWHQGMGHQLRLHFPLNIGGQLVGIAGLILSSNDRLDEFAQQQAVVLAQQAAIAMQMERLARLVESSAVRTERERMAAEIHDNLAQSFTSIAMQSESLAGLLAGDHEKARVLRLIERTAREGLAEARMSVLALLPADGWPGSLDHALAALAERSSILGGIGCRFESKGIPCAMPGPVQESLLRIAQEATSNAMRHSGGTQVVIRLDYARQRLRLCIEDDGRGLPSADGQRQNGGFGVAGMDNRARAIGGTLALHPSALGGVAVTVDVPCQGATPAAGTAA